eukprot:7391177-Ditylum_brightwellii.AAC.1
MSVMEQDLVKTGQTFLVAVRDVIEMRGTQTSGDWCRDLKISSDNCVSGKYGQKVPICGKREVLDALMEAAYDPESFFNHG